MPHPDHAIPDDIPDDLTELADRLRDCARDTPHHLAAVDLLIAYRGAYWLRQACVRAYLEVDRGGQIRLIFGFVAAALQAGEIPRGPASETGILRLACDLARDRYDLSQMPPSERRLVRQALATATR